MAMTKLFPLLLLLAGCAMEGHHRYYLGGDYAGRGSTEYDEFYTNDGRQAVCVSHPNGWTCHVK
jgi:hypothetical protein